MACPFFIPTEKLEGGTWLHASRLPLGCGWSGNCTAPGHEGEAPSQEELRDFCNLGYADGCARLPRQRTWDSVRFGARTLANDGANESARRIHVRYVCERDHRPVEHGFLEFHADEARWVNPHSDHRVQRMAECFLATYLEGRKSQEAKPAAAG